MDQTITYRLQRRPTVNGFTVGSVTRIDPDGTETDHLWFTGEDQIREIDGVPVADWKIQDATAIPAGRYRIVITESPHFHRRLPLIVDVPGFEGIRIHAGNTKIDTKGCILPGLTVTETGVWKSALAFGRWYAQIEAALLAGDRVWIEIENPPSKTDPI